jgi:hypothetical protein
MNKIILALLFPIFLIAQNKDCVFEIDQKTDSTSTKIMQSKLMHERVLGSNSEYLFFSLLNSNGIPMLQIQQVQNSKDFIPTTCLNQKSRIVLQLTNGKIVNLISYNEDVCSELSSIDGINTRLLNGYFLFTKENYEELKKSPVSLMRIQFTAENKSYVLKKLLFSESLLESSNPESFFMDYLNCVE